MNLQIGLDKRFYFIGFVIIVVAVAVVVAVVVVARVVVLAAADSTAAVATIGYKIGSSITKGANCIVHAK